MISLYLVLLKVFQKQWKYKKSKEKYDAQNNWFSFILFSQEGILKAMKSLYSISIWNIQLKSWFENFEKFNPYSIHICSERLTNIFNECLINSKFPDKLTSAYALNLFKNVWKTTIMYCYLKNYYDVIICKINSQSILLISAKAAAHKILY